MSLMRTEQVEGATLWSFDPVDARNESAVFAADNPGSREWTQHLTEPFSLVNWIARRIELTDDETGESSPAIRIVLLDDHGDTMTFVSVGIGASLDLIRTLRGDGPYDPPIPVVVLPVKTRRGHQTLKLRPVAAAAIIETKAKK